MPTLVYEYGIAAPHEGLEALEQQMRLAHQYGNKLVELERERRIKIVTIQKAAGGEAVLALEAKIAEADARINALLGSVRASRAKQRQHVSIGDDGRTALKTLRSEVKDHRSALRGVLRETRELTKPLVEAVNEEFWESQRKSRGTFSAQGLYWGTYQLVEEASRRSRSSEIKCRRCGFSTKSFVCCGEPVLPRFRHFDGNGAVAAHFQNEAVMPTSNVFIPNNMLRIEPVSREAWNSPSRSVRRKDCRTQVALRIASDGKTPVWVVCRLWMHRELPAGKITWGRIYRRRIGNDVQWRLLITVNTEPDEVAPKVSKAAMDIGWRKIDGELRVAYVVGDDGEHQELRLPAALLAEISKVSDLVSIRKKNFTAALADLATRLSKLDVPPPEWLVNATSTLAQWRSQGRLAALALAWRSQRFRGDEETFAALESWRQHDKHLWTWETNLRDQLLRRRREIYRVFSRRLAERYGTVTIEAFDLRGIARRQPTESDKFDPQVARTNRQIAALNTLRSILKQALASCGGTLEVINGAYTTQRCHGCGSLEKFDALKNLSHTCSWCQENWDQDANAALNMVASGDSVT